MMIVFFLLGFATGVGFAVVFKLFLDDYALKKKCGTCGERRFCWTSADGTNTCWRCANTVRLPP